MSGKHGDVSTLSISELTSGTFHLESFPTQHGLWLIVKLSQSQKLNALDLTFFKDFQKVLLLLNSPGYSGLILTSQSDQVFCAGGDIKSLLELVTTQKQLGAQTFFDAEYSIDQQLYELQKPVIAITPGYCFGGGMGISQSASLRIALQNTTLAMPEAFIGLFADVGANYFMRHIPLSLRRFLVHFGCRLSSEEALNLGLVDAISHETRVSAALESLKKWIVAQTTLLTRENITTFYFDDFRNSGLNTSMILREQRSIQKEFENQLDWKSIEFLNESELDLESLARFRTTDSWLNKKRTELRWLSEASLYIQHSLFKDENIGIPEVFKREKDLVIWASQRSDFNEGVTSKLIAKSKTPPNFKNDLKNDPVFQTQLKALL